MEKARATQRCCKNFLFSKKQFEEEEEVEPLIFKLKWKQLLIIDLIINLDHFHGFKKQFEHEMCFAATDNERC